MNSKFNNSPQGGFSILESVIAIALASGIILFASMFCNNQDQEKTYQMNLIRAGQIVDAVSEQLTMNPIGDVSWDPLQNPHKRYFDYAGVEQPVDTGSKFVLTWNVTSELPLPGMRTAQFTIEWEESTKNRIIVFRLVR